MTTDSLNAGIELDQGEGEEANREDALAEVIFDNAQDGQVPELDDNVVMISSLSQQHDQIDKLEEHVNTNQNFEQSLAAEAHSLTGNFITSQRPLTMFTSLPTRTGLEVALEALGEEKKNIIVRLYEKIKEYVVKLLEWLGSVFTDKARLGSTPAQVEDFFNRYFDKKTKIAEGHAIVLQRKEDLFSRLKDILQRKNVEQAVLDNVATFGQKILEHFEKSDERFQAFRESLAASPLMVSVLSNSDYIKSIKELSGWMDNITEGMKDITQSLNAIDGSIVDSSVEEAQAFVAETEKEMAKTRKAIEDIEARFNTLTTNQGNKKYLDRLANYSIEDLLEDAHLLQKQRSSDAWKTINGLTHKAHELGTVYQGLVKALDKIVNEFNHAQAGPDGQKSAYGTFHKFFRELLAVFSKGSQSSAHYMAEALRVDRQSLKLVQYTAIFIDGLNRYVVEMVRTIPEAAQADVQTYMQGLGFDFEAAAKAVDEKDQQAAA